MQHHETGFIHLWHGRRNEMIETHVTPALWRGISTWHCCGQRTWRSSRGWTNCRRALESGQSMDDLEMACCADRVLTHGNTVPFPSLVFICLFFRVISCTQSLVSPVLLKWIRISCHVRGNAEWDWWEHRDRFLKGCPCTPSAQTQWFPSVAWWRRHLKEHWSVPGVDHMRFFSGCRARQSRHGAAWAALLSW